MKIISKFTDYYDSVQGVAFDGDTLYKRETVRHKMALDSRTIAHYHSRFSVVFVCVGGKVYPLYKLFYQNVPNWCSLKERSLPYAPHRDSTYYYFGSQAAIWKFFGAKEGEKLVTRLQERGHWGWHTRSLPEFINEFAPQVPNMSKAPIFSVIIPSQGSAVLVENPMLALYKFEKVVDPYTLYQDLVMWFNNEAINEYPPVQITDNKVNIERHGFDYKSSFRQAPTKHNKRRKNK